ncbi:ABC transporter substrate-binding protein [Gluconobacter sp. Dm-62]|uniref:ABC transporter substrate-binding protein n=1 Tax=Gluconobacter sp. Dm-62 TaxID=2799804 RepID=UPI001B8A927D|nr:ABC transporter substrate-binding protein [Gluconobacter sp. Dm-62]MBS1101519.1 ABC transporter substrate-binding protein [Gluconobacter sp. Dm-62]
MICRFSPKVTLSLLSACLLAGPVAMATLSPVALAQTVGTETAPADASSAVAPISALYDALKAAQKTGKTAQQRATMIAPAVDRAFDLEAILRRSVGVRYNSLSPSDRTRLLGSFRQFTIARYASSFKPEAQAAFTVAPQTRSNPTGGQIVDTTIGGMDGGDVTPIDYIMTNGASGWRITDVLLNAHISQVAAQRADFGGALSQGGASGLADHLDSKTAHFLHD